MKPDKKILKEMEDLDRVMNKRLSIEKKIHEGSLKGKSDTQSEPSESEM